MVRALVSQSSAAAFTSAGSKNGNVILQRYAFPSFWCPGVPTLCDTLAIHQKKQVCTIKFLARRCLRPPRPVPHHSAPLAPRPFVGLGRAAAAKGPCEDSGIQLLQDSAISQHDATRTRQSDGSVRHELRQGARNGLDSKPQIVGDVLA
jgi:hypothetical protein